MTFSLLSKHRSKLMCVAMLWIALFHSSSWFQNKALSFLKVNGFGGVDIFVFVFAIGMVYSLKKRSDLCAFYFARVKRLFPYVLPVLIFACVFYGYDLHKTILFVHLLDFWGNNNTALWYVSGMMVWILISPLVYHLFRKNKWVAFGVALWISVVSFLLFKEKTQMIFASRFPVFFLGFYFGELSSENVQLKMKHLLAALLSLFAGVYFLYYNYHHFGGLMWSCGLYWYPFVLIAPSMCILMAVFFEVLEVTWKWKKISGLVDWLGAFTLEFYLFHEMMIKTVDWYIYYVWDPQGIVRNLGTFLITLVLAISYHTLVQQIVKQTEKHFQKISQ